MRKRLAIAFGGAISAMVVGTLLFGTVLAAGPGPANGKGSVVGGRDIPISVAAQLTGLTEDQVLAELEGGKTILALLEEKGIDLTTFHEAVADAREAALADAVAQGTLTAEQAQNMEQRMEQNQASPGPHGPMRGNGECASIAGDANEYSWGSSSDGAGPGLNNRWGAKTR